MLRAIICPSSSQKRESRIAPVKILRPDKAIGQKSPLRDEIIVEARHISLQSEIVARSRDESRRSSKRSLGATQMRRDNSANSNRASRFQPFERVGNGRTYPIFSTFPRWNAKQMPLFYCSHVGFGVLRRTSVSVRELFCFYLLSSLFPANCIYMLRSKYHEQNGNVCEIGKFGVPFPSISSNFTRAPKGLRVILLCFAEFKLLLTTKHCHLQYFLLINVLISRATNESRIERRIISRNTHHRHEISQID